MARCTPSPYAILIALALAAAIPGVVHAHGKLTRSVPAAGARLVAVPHELRLTFSEPVELALGHVDLTGPDGARIALSALRRGGDSAQVVVADIVGPVRAGRLTVDWRMTGRDGHAVHGTFFFDIASGAAGVAVDSSTSGAAREPAAVGSGAHAAGAPRAGRDSASRAVATGAEGRGGFDAESPLYVLVRWWNYLALMGLIGAGVCGRVVAPRVDGGNWSARLAGTVSSRAAAIGRAAAVLLLLGAVARLVAQGVSVNGGWDGAAGALPAGGMLVPMVGHTLWGLAWMLQVVAAVVALLALGRRTIAWSLPAGAAVIAALAAALSGHAAATPRIAPVMVVADMLHILGAGGWLGTLFVMVAAGFPVLVEVASAERGDRAARLLTAFSPMALACGALVALTGLLAAWVHLGSLPALWQSRYGVLLVLKLCVLVIVGGLGAVNWLIVRPKVASEGGLIRLRRTATVELVMGVLVLAVTAVLVAAAPPALTG